MIGQDLDALAGSRCATHPDVPAAITCTRCGNFACDACVADLHAVSRLCRDCAARTEQGSYYVVPPWRVPVFYMLSFSTYGLWWFYKNWQAIKRRDGSSIWPAARACFSQFMYFALVQDLNERSRLKAPGIADSLSSTAPALRGGASLHELGTGPALGFFVLAALYRLPEPYWLITFGAGFCLLPAAQRIAELEGAQALEASRPLRARHYALIACGVLSWALVLLGLLVPA